MDTYSKQKHYNPGLLPWLTSPECNARVEQLFVKYAIEESQREAFLGLIQGVFYDEIALRSIPDVAQTALFLGRDESKLFTRDVIGLLVLPVEVAFTEQGVDEYLEELGAQHSDYEMPRDIERIREKMAEQYDLMIFEGMLDSFEAEVEEGEGEMAGDARSSMEKTQELEQQLAKHYKTIESDDMKKKRTVFTKHFEKDQKEFVTEFYKAINDRDVVAVLAGLLVLAAKGKLKTLLTDDMKIQGLLGKHLEKKFSPEVASHFYANSSEPVYIAYFLRHLLIDTLQLTENDAGALVIHLLNEYTHATGDEIDMLAYGDVTKGGFVWRSIKAVGDRLELE